MWVVDWRPAPPAFHRAQQAISALAPGVPDKVRFVRADVRALARRLAQQRQLHAAAATTKHAAAAASAPPVLQAQRQGALPQTALQQREGRPAPLPATQAALLPDQGQEHQGSLQEAEEEEEELVRELWRRSERGEVGVVAVHACGALTDACLDVAVALRAPVAAMACCYTGTAAGAPLGARRALGVGLAADIDR